ncbi:hypothetical protein WDU94_013797 [Cyamophila willieti]
MLSCINIAKATKCFLSFVMIVLLTSKATPGASYAISGTAQPVTSFIGSDDEEPHYPPPVITPSQLSRVYVAETDKSQLEKGPTTTDQMKTEGTSIPETKTTDDSRPVTETHDREGGQLYPRSATV